MRLPGALMVLALAHGLSGCSSDRLPAAPTPGESPTVVPPGPGTVAAEQWKLTSTLKSVDGPKACLPEHATDVGQSDVWHMEIRRFGGHSIQLAYDVGNPEVNEQYAGTVVADEISASTALNSGATLCGGARFDFVAEGHLSGRFSADGRALSAEETYSLRFTSGEAITFHYEWKASRQ